MIDQRLMDLLCQNGVRHMQRVNDALLRDPDLRRLTDKEMAIAIVLYAAGLANLTDLKLEDFVALAAYAHNNVEITRADETGKVEETVGNA